MTKNIIVKNSYIESILATTQNGIEIKNENFAKILNKSLPVKVSYWLARAVDKMTQEARTYFNARQDLIQKYAQRYEEDGKDEHKEWKKDDIIVSNTGNISFGDNQEKFMLDFIELQNIESDLGIPTIKIDLDKLPEFTTIEISAIIPLIEINS